MQWVERASESNTILLWDFQIVQRRAKITVLRALGCRGRQTHHKAIKQGGDIGANGEEQRGGDHAPNGGEAGAADERVGCVL
jgi:hypothetical protein